MRKIQRLSSKEILISRGEDSGSPLVVEGYAAVYNSESKPLSLGNGKQFIETIERGAFDNAVANVNNQTRDCVATFQHQRKTMMARTSSGTLELESDDVGLKFRFEMPNTQVGRDVSVMLERRDLSQCSFVARVNNDGFKMERDDDGQYKQTISRVDELLDISLVIDPAYSDTYIAEITRSIEETEEVEAKTKEDELELQRKTEDEAAEKESQADMLNKLIARANEKK